MRAQIIKISKAAPDGQIVTWFEIETIHGNLTHRSRDRTYTTAEEAREGALSLGHDVVDGVVEDW